MAQDFYPFVENDNAATGRSDVVQHPARIAVYDDAAAAPRVVVVEPKEVRPYLEEITLQVTQLSQAQGGTIPFMVIREIVENFIHAFFMEPTISILDGGNTIRFSDQGPGIAEKERALQYGTTSATEEMRRYIRGVGSGLPYVQQYMLDKGGSLRIEDNISGGTVVTLSTRPAQVETHAPAPNWSQPYTQPYQQPYQQQAPSWPQQQPYPSWQQPQPQQWQQPQQYQGWPQQQQAWGQPSAPTWPATPVPQQQDAPILQGPVPGWPSISQRGRMALDYLAAHDSVGPSDLTRVHGGSQPTWSRELQALEEQGLIRKDGQKRRLTGMGQALLRGGGQ
ncbi:MAG: MarR family transcriptional regulator [Atopobiaceae bacterium]|nr:MarR family transcriptional regulator [Atopobiaceae bacterium]